MINFTTENVEETIDIGKKLAKECSTGDVIILSGDLGAGKTQFSKGIAQGLGISDEITSPTFNIMSEYDGTDLKLLHFDLYRLESPKELEDIDYFANLESGAVCLVEWGDKIEDAMPRDYLQIYIENISAEIDDKERALFEEYVNLLDADSPKSDEALDKYLDYSQMIHESDYDDGSFKGVIESGVRQDILNGADIDVENLRYFEIESHGKGGAALERKFTKLLME